MGMIVMLDGQLHCPPALISGNDWGDKQSGTFVFCHVVMTFCGLTVRVMSTPPLALAVSCNFKVALDAQMVTGVVQTQPGPPLRMKSALKLAQLRHVPLDAPDGESFH